MKNDTFTRRYLITIATLWLMVSHAPAQQHRLVFEEIGVKQGLPEEYVRDIIQDDLGYIWMATQNGLVKHDGYHLKVFKAQEESDGLKIKNIASLMEGRDHKIWLGSFDSPGIGSYDPVQEQFNHFVDTTGSFGGMYSVLKEDLAGNIWVAKKPSEFGNLTLSCFNPEMESWIHFPFRARPKYNGLISTNGAIAESKKDSSIWVLDQNRKTSLLQKEVGQDTFLPVIEPGEAIPGTNVIDSISAISALRNGNLVLNTRQHIVIWDPILKQGIQVFSANTGEDNDLASGDIVKWGVFQAIDNRIWVSHIGGNLSIIDLSANTIEQVRWSSFRKKNPWLPLKVTNIVPAAENEKELWFEIRGNRQVFYGRYDYTAKVFSFYNRQFNDHHNPEVPNGPGNQFLTDHTGLLWIGSWPSLYKQSPKKRQFDYFLNNPNYSINLPSDTIIQLFADRRNWLWITTRRGLGRFKPEKNEFTVFRHNPEDPSTIPNNNAYGLMEDSQGDLWIGSMNGFAKYIPKTDSFQRYLYDPAAAGWENGVSGFIEIEKDSFLVLVFEKGIYTFDKVSGAVKPKYLLKDQEKNGLTSRAIFRIHLDSYGDLWAGAPFATNSGVFHLRKGQDHFENYLPNEQDDASISSAEFFFFYEDKDRNFWIGTDAGLNLFDREKNQFIRFRNEDITSVDTYIQSEREEVYFITYSSGLISITPDSLTYQAFTEKDGLLYNGFKMIFHLPLKADASGNFWLPTRRGLSVFDPETETFTNYTKRDGFQIEYPNHVAVDQNGIVWIAGNKGLHRIDPTELEKKDSTLPKMVLTGLRINDQLYDNPDSVLLDQHISYTKQISLSHRQKNLTFEFVALHYLRPEDNQYSWKLENYDDNWSEPSLERKAIYTNLSPGTYTFRVKGSNADGIWNEEGTRLMITILPPWWATTWAYLGYLILLGGLVWGVVQWRTRYLRKQRQQLQTKVSEQTQELRERNAELRIAKEEALAAEAAAREANETKSNFLSTVSHELRTPLTSVLGFAKIIRKRFTERVKPVLPTDDKKLNRTVDQIEKNLDVVVLEGERLTNLINDVLDLAKIESGRTDWHLESIDLNLLVHQAYQSTSSLFEGKGLDYQENLTPKLPTITGDHDKLVQVMINLLSNAVKFTDEGTVTVATKLEKDAIIVAVKDTGIGIAEKDLSTVFEKFRQVGDTLTDKPKGTGLGLPICQEIIEYLGGEIWVDSTLGVGSTFAFSLPLKEKNKLAKRTSKMEELIEELKKKLSLSSVVMPTKQNSNILVVDDEPSIRELLRQELSDSGYRVTLAENGKQALQKVREQLPDMIILDVMMPELNGFDLAAILKNDPKTLNIPILILSIVEDKERGYQIGVDRYLHKPIDTNLLLKEVETLLSNGTSSKKILVIDENQSTVATMAAVLHAKGFEVVEANGTNLLEVARASMPDVIILNAALNEREQIMRTLRFEKGLESVMVIMYQ